ncbi:hypothetical protein I302_108138 [Kwoniella bestiolae CBS 10118]|uniref:NmrA-like domain-containing protein n=1 Tax=Kwoniella bestiolae CBS 10118 TaxID=1296100 RepID=A0A1B9FWK3_9TREE|nr:hypothetical protein I302_07496 [Kwoniella bestiolae CBS 10118]OCF23143.1 hypothetical protein I302_07496 [Kwoniella bestiolae CBS 10118]
MSARTQQIKNVIVFGATGQQGTAFIEALSAHHDQYKIYALSRDPSTPSSIKLSALPGVEVVQVNKDYMDKPEMAFAATGLKEDEVYGVFNVQGYVSEKVELAQGKGIIVASKRWNVKHFIYSSISFGGLDDTNAAGMEVKRDIENYLISSGIAYTILRPTQFMDNLLPSSAFMFKISRTILLRQTFYNHPERKHQLISSRDIGKAGAEALSHPEKWLNVIIELAGDELTVQEIEDVYREVLGSEPSLTFWGLAAFVRWVSPLGPMARFFDDHGFKVDIPQLKEDLPQVGLEDLRGYLQRYKASQ